MMTSNRLAAVYEADELLVAMAYDGDGNRVFQLNYNLHIDEDWKAYSGNGSDTEQGVIMNEYVKEHGESEQIFLITQ